MPSIPSPAEAAARGRALRQAAGLPTHLLWQTPRGVARKQSLDALTCDVVHRGTPLWGRIGDWRTAQSMSRDGLLDALMTVDALTDTGDWSYVPPRALRCASRLLHGVTRVTDRQARTKPDIAPREQRTPHLR